MVEDKITEFINSYDKKPVVWGEDDCTAWAAKWIECATGQKIDLPKYTDREQANAMIDQAGGLVDLIGQYLGPPVGYGEPQIGDVAVIETGRSGDVCVVMLKNYVAVWRADHGVRQFRVRPRFMKAYWTVGKEPS